MGPDLTSALNIPIGSLEGLGKDALWVVFAIFMVIFAAVSAVLLFHWKNYSLGNSRIRLAGKLYFAGSIFFIVASAVSLLLI